jgi:hypothetical protein
VEEGRPLGRTLLELPIQQSFHESDHTAPHPLDEVNVLISGGMGFGLQTRLKQKGILALSTAETDPDHAVAAWLDGSLIELPPNAHDGHDHDHGHGKTMPITTLSANILSQPLED